MAVLGLAVSARTVTPDQARQIAGEFFGEQPQANAPLKIKALGSGADQSAPQPYYIFNSSTPDHGFVIISGDDRAQRILGYSDTGTFDPDNIPPQLADLLGQYATQIKSIKSGDTHPSWNVPARVADNEDGILLETANWGQGAPYNALTPEFDGEHAPTGCVATAMAIVMKYHNWPPKTNGESMRDYFCQNLSFDYSDYIIDWDKLSKDVHSSEFMSEISKLMLAAGVSVHTIYDEKESGSQTWYVGHILTERFSYSPECQFIERQHFDDSSWSELIDDQLSRKLPLLYIASAVNGVGHCFIIDGKSKNSLYHINWGWDGLSNGYFALDNLNPEDHDFVNSHSIIYNISPDRSGRTYSRSFICNANVYASEDILWHDWNFSSPDILPGNTYRYVSPFISFAPYVHSLIRLAIVDTNDEIVDFVGDVASYVSPGGCFYNGTNLYQYFEAPKEPLKDGFRYQLVGKEVFSEENELSQEERDDLNYYKLVLGGIIHPSYFMPYGNRSELCTVRWHRERHPVIYEDERFQTSWAEGLETLPKGANFGRNLYCPSIGELNMNVICKDDGRIVDPHYVFNSCGEGAYSSNVSLFSDEVDIYLDYKLPSDTKHIPDGILEENIVHLDGLVYYLNKADQMILCGYDEPDVDCLIIPDIIMCKGKEYPVVGLGDFALLGHNASILQLGRNVTIYGNWSIGYLKNLKKLVIPNSKYNNEIFNSSTFAAFSPLEKIFIHSGEFLKRFDWHYILGHTEGWQPRNRIDLYLSDVGNSENLYPVYFVNLPWRYIVPTYVFMPSYLPVVFNIPGINKFKDWLNIDSEYREMWLYSIDRASGRIRIQPNIDGIEIKRVIINGVENHPAPNYLYSFDTSDKLTVSVDYRLYDEQNMTTVYPPDFNEQLPNENLDADIWDINVDRIGVRVNHGVISITGTNFRNVKIYNTVGSLVYSGKDSSIDGLSPGVYIVVVDGMTFKVAI